jgi:hypothetical protein
MKKLLAAGLALALSLAASCVAVAAPADLTAFPLTDALMSDADLMAADPVLAPLASQEVTRGAAVIDLPQGLAPSQTAMTDADDPGWMSVARVSPGGGSPAIPALLTIGGDGRAGG